MVLGEAKCGKTHEFRQQVERLKEGGKFAFFLPVEQLLDHDLLDLLSPDEEHSLDTWLHRSTAKAYFFLDAVDELRLRQGSFGVALRKLSRQIQNKTELTHLFVSCRPADWNNALNIDDIQRFFPALDHSTELLKETSQDVLPGTSDSEIPLRFSGPAEGQAGESRSVEPSVFSLMPLTMKQIKEFACVYSADSADLFVHEIQEQQTIHLFQTPIDVMSGIERMKIDGKLGNMETQISMSIQHRIQETPEKLTVAQSLSLAKALRGAERLALALTLFKKRSLVKDISTIASHESSASQILNDWSQSQQSDLLSRAIFDLASINSLHFYHRSAQDYLAAKRLMDLMQSGLPIKDAKYLLFRRSFREEVVVPSMEPMASWLALWNEDIRAEVEARKPELLFQQGFPSCLPIGHREKLLASFVQSYSGSDWRGMFILDADILRLADPRLSPIVKELWLSARKGHDTREVFLNLILLTPLSDCADLALDAALDADLPDDHRAIGCQAVAHIGSAQQKQVLGRSLLRDQWPDRSIHLVMPHLFPSILEVDELVAVAKRTNEVSNTVHGLGYSLYRLVERVRGSREELRRLRDALTGEIWQHPLKDCTSHSFRSEYQHFVDAVIAACAFDEAVHEGCSLENWAWSAAVALHLENEDSTIIARNEKGLLASNIKKNTRMREAYFWARYSIENQLRPQEDARAHALCLLYDDPISLGASDEDVPWLLNALADTSSPIRRATAFFAAMTIWQNSGIENIATAVRSKISNVPELCDDYNKLIGEYENRPREQSLLPFELNTKGADAELDPLNDWRNRVVGNPRRMLQGGERNPSLLNLFRWLQMESNSNSTWFTWDEEKIRGQFSDEFLEALRPELARLWRSAEPLLFSERPPTETDSIPEAWLQALMGVYSEADDPEWTGKLTASQARLATRLSMLELNGFANFLPGLERKFPVEVGEIIVLELAAQLNDVATNEDCPLLQEIRFFGSELTRKKSADFLGRALHWWPRKLSSKLQSCFKDALALIQSFGSANVTRLAATYVRKHLDLEGLEPQDRVPWARALVMFDLADGCSHVLEETADTSTEAAAQTAVSFFATAFGNRANSDARQEFSLLPSRERIDLLFKLVIRAFEVVKRADDSKHEGVYSPGIREFAEDTRNYLLEVLLNQQGREAYNAIIGLSEAHAFSHMKDRLQHLAKILAAKATDTHPMSLSAFRCMDQGQNLIATDHESLNHIMLSRLDDFGLRLLTSGFPNIKTLQRVKDERELRSNIAGWLKDNSRGAYAVSQEEATMNEGKTDIRLAAAGSRFESVIEVKLDDRQYRWSGSKLEAALRTQLVENYLGKTECQSGCLLICMRETRGWQNPHSRRRMSLSQTVNWLQEIAEEIMQSNPKLLVSVKGVDLTTK